MQSTRTRKSSGAHIRRAEFADAKAIFSLIKENPRELLARPLSDIIQNIDRFLVCERNGELLGAVSWQVLPEPGSLRDPCVEIKSLAVRKGRRGHGLGGALLKEALRVVRQFRPLEVLVLTFSPPFFERFGFRQIPKERIMHKLYTGCMNCTKYDSPFTCPEVAMRLDLSGGAAGTEPRP